MTRVLFQEARPQAPLPTQAYDRWIALDGEVKAEFHRADQGFLVRFPDEADFQIEANCQIVTVWPALGEAAQLAQTLFQNAIIPVLANHTGGLCLHGSAIALDGKGVAFLGHSRSGKTTLAGAFAQANAPFLTEDVIELGHEQSEYWVEPKEAVLRVFRDSAEFLLGSQTEWSADDEGKHDVPACETIPFRKQTAPLRAIMILGSSEPRAVSIQELGAQSALAQLMPHSFILDVEDKSRLKAHFTRLADLAQSVPCYELDYRRDYSELSEVVSAVRAAVTK